MPVLQNIAEHDFHLPIFPNLARKAGETEDAHMQRVRILTEKQAEETDDQFESRMKDSSILVPKMRKPKGEEGKPDFEAGGPGELVVTDDQLALMKRHRIARHWFGVDVKKGQGIIVKEETEKPRAKSAGKAA